MVSWKSAASRIFRHFVQSQHDVLLDHDAEQSRTLGGSHTHPLNLFGTHAGMDELDKCTLLVDHTDCTIFHLDQFHQRLYAVL
jgi:hypothetical protein